MSKQIFWIASYPKSGNTLLRFILISLFFTKDGTFSFDKSKYISQFDMTGNIEKNIKIFGRDYNKIGDMKIFYKYIQNIQTKEALGFDEDFIFLKTHAGLFQINNNSFTTINNTRGIIYIIRDPRDVSISWSKHNGLSIDQSIDFMCNDYAYYKWVKLEKHKGLYNEKTIPKSFMSSWEKHVKSWTSVKWKIPILVLKYEDLINKKRNTIKEIISFFSKNYKFNFGDKNKRIDNIIKSTDFKILQKHEEEKGFIEASEHNKF